MQAFFTKALSGGGHSVFVIGQVNRQNAELVRLHTGKDIARHIRQIESSDIRRTMASHGDSEREAERGQIAIQKADFARIPEIVEQAYVVMLKGCEGSRKTQRLEYQAVIDGKHCHYVEEIRPGARIVALKTMRKRLGETRGG